jgi:TrmH family RNA methyltransferase
MIITSLTNPRIKDIVRLRDKKQRDKTGLTIVEGVKETDKLLASGIPVESVYVCPEFLEKHGGTFLLKRLKATEVTEVTAPVYDKIGYGDRLEGILAICRPQVRKISSLTKDDSFFVVLESVEKPGNLGAVLRICDGAGVDGLLVCEGHTDIYNPNVIRASLGTVFTVPVVWTSNEEALSFFQKNKVRTVALLPEADAFYTEQDLRGPLALIVGSEDKGLSNFWEKKADVRVKIPMAGSADSLNVSTATAVVVYEAVRQRIT